MRRLFLFLLLFFAAHFACAATISLDRAAVARIANGVMMIDANYDFKLTKRQVVAVNGGMPIYFSFEWKVTQPRWYWFDKVVLENEAPIALTYLPLTHQYRVTADQLHEDFANIKDAEASVGTILARPLFRTSQLASGERYTLSFRLVLDLDRMSAPMQLNAMHSRDWQLSSEWHSLDFLP